MGLSKSGVPGVVRFADVLVIEARPLPGQAPRVETFSFKSRFLKPLVGEALEAPIRVDAQAALDYYGGRVNIRRPSIKGSVQVQRVRLVYEGGSRMPAQPVLDAARWKVEREVKGVEVVIQ